MVSQISFSAVSGSFCLSVEIPWRFSPSECIVVMGFWLGLFCVAIEASLSSVFTAYLLCSDPFGTVPLLAHFDEIKGSGGMIYSKCQMINLGG